MKKKDSNPDSKPENPLPLFLFLWINKKNFKLYPIFTMLQKKNKKTDKRDEYKEMKMSYRNMILK